jgi:threonyl-tRNA synthetase
VLELYPDSKLTLGPAIENGFYYDIDVKGKITDTNLAKIEKKMRELLPTWTSFSKEVVSQTKAKKFFADNVYKLELVNEIIKKGEKITFYTAGGFTDLCRGGHSNNPAKEINPDSFRLDRVAGAYWRGDEKNKMLTRVYGLAFATKTELEEYLHLREEAEKRDHKKLGPALDLFTFSELVGSGLPLWTPKGTILRNLLDNFVWELRKSYGYEQVEIPHITKKELYEISGHWDKFKNELFCITTREAHEFAMKPMNCPHHTQIYARRQWSYREIPQRYANTTMCYRDEQSGELSGLSRVRSFTQDDAHVFCRESQSKEEFLKIWDIVHKFYNTFGFELRTRLSLHDPKHPKKYLGDNKRWQLAENMLRAIAKEKKTDTIEAVGEAAFYGPKLDFLAKDSLGREWQVATIQLDMNMPERFDLTCINEKGDRERIVMIHAAIMGSIERFLSIAIEHFAGAFPVWLAPVQVSIIPVSEKFKAYAKNVFETLHGHDIRAELSNSNDTLGKRIREAEIMKIPYIVVIGEKEEKANTVNVRRFSSGNQEEIKTEKFIKNIKEEIINKVV